MSYVQLSTEGRSKENIPLKVKAALSRSFSYFKVLTNNYWNMKLGTWLKRFNIPCQPKRQYQNMNFARKSYLHLNFADFFSLNHIHTSKSWPVQCGNVALVRETPAWFLLNSIGFIKALSSLVFKNCIKLEQSYSLTYLYCRMYIWVYHLVKFVTNVRLRDL